MPTIALHQLRRRLRSLRADSRGNVILTFAFALVPIMAFVGTAIDYSRASSARTAMQGAIDSVALMLSRDAPNLTTAQLDDKANAYFKAIFNRPEAKNVVLSTSFSSPQQGSFKLILTGTGSVDTSAFLKALVNWGIGREKIDFNVSAEAQWGIKRLELALALDNTGSMSSSGKMTALKTASKTLLTTLKNASKVPGDIKIAIIPFDTTVNLGTSYKDNDWFDYDQIDCNGSSWGNGCNSTSWKTHWEGCVRDRTQPYDVQDTAPTSATPATLFPADDCGSLAKQMPLTYDWTALNNRVDEMTPAGYTNVTIGLVWAWHALTVNAPLSEAATPTPDLDKVIILLTDGDNTKAWNNSNNSEITSESTINARTSAACTNIKAASIKIYTVRVIDGNSSLLQGCATNPSMYYDVQQASQLNGVFSAIAQNLANLRLAK